MTDQMNEDNGGMMAEDQTTPEQSAESAAENVAEELETAQPEAEGTQMEVEAEEPVAEVESDEAPTAEAEAEQSDEAEDQAEPMAELELDEAQNVVPVEEPGAEVATEPQTPAEPTLETELEPEAEPEPAFEPLMNTAPEPQAGLEDESDGAEQADEAEAAPAQPEEEPDDGRAWYVVHCYSGYENKVRHNLEQRIESMGMKDRIFDVVVPTEEEIEVKEGKRKTVERRVFPGYILVNMVLSEESWYVVRNTPGVTSFVGQGNEPLPLRPEEVATIIKRMEADAPRIKVSFRQGERVRIVDGPFNDFRGTVDEIDMERTKVRVMVNFFGRETPVELDFLQVEKA